MSEVAVGAFAANLVWESACQVVSDTAMATGAEIALLGDQQKSRIGRVWVVARQALALNSRHVGRPGTALGSLMALQANLGAIRRSSHRRAGLMTGLASQLRMNRGAQKALGRCAVRWMAGAAISAGDRKSTVCFREAAVGVVAGAAKFNLGRYEQ